MAVTATVHASVLYVYILTKSSERYPKQKHPDCKSVRPIRSKVIQATKTSGQEDKTFIISPLIFYREFSFHNTTDFPPFCYYLGLFVKVAK